jgi:replication-associated recombination protein RarA
MVNLKYGGYAPVFFIKKRGNMKLETKYIPTSLDEVIFPNEAVKCRIKGYAEGKLNGHIILYGPNGTGKTTVANLIVKQLGGENAQIDGNEPDELLAKSDLKMYLKQAASFAALTTSKKYFLILNEFDNTKKNMSKFWTSLDACGKGIMALITTNQPMDIHPSIRSRCDLIEFPGITANSALLRIQECLQAEGLVLPDPQVLQYLKTKEQFKDLRKYFKVADEILFLWNTKQAMPLWTKQKIALKIV